MATPTRGRSRIGTLGDSWYESEESTSAGLVAELQRIRRRSRARPLLVLLLAAGIASGLTLRLVMSQRVVESQVVLALTEGTMAENLLGLPVHELREYVTSVLISDHALLNVIEDYDLHPLRRRLGNEYALTGLREQMEIEIWKNSFLYYTWMDHRARKSARIGITVSDSDPERAHMVALAIAGEMIHSHDAERQKVTTALAREVAAIRASIHDQLMDLSAAIAARQAAITTAKQAGKHGVASVLHVELAALDRAHAQAEQQLAQIATSREGIADQISAAGLGVNLGIVEQQRPPRPAWTGLGLVLLSIVIATGSLVGSAMLVSTFDSRVHDTDDVVRMGLPVLGHVPAFNGDGIGSLRWRSIERRR